MPNQPNEEGPEKEAKKGKFRGKKTESVQPANKIGFLMVLGIILLIALLIWYIFNLYELKMQNELNNTFGQLENNVPQFKTDEQKTDVELIDELSNEVDTKMDELFNELDTAEQELENLEQESLTE